MNKLPITNDQYQVFFLSSPIRKPFHFFVHLWIVIIKNGKITRWEVMPDEHKKKKFGFLHKNFHRNPLTGARKSIFNKIDTWNAKIIKKITGDKKSLAKHIIETLEKINKNYPYKKYYFPYPGPNSNTYVAWIIKKFPELKIKLPWNAFGKNF